MDRGVGCEGGGGSGLSERAVGFNMQMQMQRPRIS